jgi:hypothetical protein
MTRSMTPRERVLSVLSGAKADRVPWFGDLDYYATALIARGERPKDFKERDEYIDWHRDLRVGFYQQASWPYREIIEGCDIREWREGPLRFREIRTPVGTLRECWQWSDISFSEGPVERLLKSADQLPAYRYRFKNTRYEPAYGVAERRRSQVGEIGLVMCFLPWSPLMRMVVVDAGIENVVMLHADAPEEFDETILAVKESLDRACQLAVESPAEVLMITENLSSEVVGRRFFERYLRDSYREWSGKILAAGKYSCIHMDGTLAGLLRQVSGIGFSFIEAMTPAPVGDVALGDWAGYRDGSATVYWGGIPGSYFTPAVSDGEFDRHVREVLGVMREDRRMVLGVADQVPPDALERRIRRVSELVEEHGAY